MPEACARILGWASHASPGVDPMPDLKPVVREATGAAVRRVGRFIQLALIGAGRCLAGRTPEPGTGVYLTSGRGDMEVTDDVMTEIFRDHGAPRPLSFINTVSNSACFYVAKQFGLHGRSAFVCNRWFSFETALFLALLDIEAGVTQAALAGSVDIVLPPLDIHRQRLRLAADTPVEEASHWLWLERDDGAADGHARIDRVAFPFDADALRDWLMAARGDDADACLAIGQFADAPRIAELAAACGVDRIFDYRSGMAYYDSQSGAAAGAFLREPSAGRTLLHVGSSPEGGHAVFRVRRG